MILSKQTFGLVRMVMAVAVLAALMIGLVPASTQAANTISTKQYLDTNNNGTVETIRWTMDENVTACAYEAGDWTVNTAGSINVAITGLSCTGADAILNITVTADASETGGTTAPVISYANAGTAGSVTLTSGAMTAKASQTIVDGAKPVIKTVTIEDAASSDGLIDKLTYTWTENVDTNDSAVPVAADLPTTLLPDGSTATFGSATISDPAGAAATVVVTTVGGQATVNTAAGSTAISGDLSALWVDGATNAAHATGATANETIVDSAAPIVTSIYPADEGTDKQISEDLIVSFSEAMDTGSVTFATDPTETYTQTWSNSDKTVNFVHAVYLDHSKAYTATISAANAAAGTSVTLTGMPYAWNFTTESGGGGGGGGGGGSSSHNDDNDDDSSVSTGGKTLGELQAMLTELLKKLADMKGTSAPVVSGAFAADLDLGASGADVSKLQAWLIAKGYKIEAGATGYFGAQTQAALAEYQKAMNIAPAVGFFGPKTRASVNGS